MKKLPDVLIGASIPAGERAIKDFLKLKLGRIVLLKLPKKSEQACKVMRLCRESGIYVMLSEVSDRGLLIRRKDAPARKTLNVAIAEAGEFFLGRYTIGEAGGLLYWPKGYTLGKESTYPNLPPCQGPAEAHRKYLEYLRNYLDFERKKIGDGNLVNGESSLVFPYHAEAGIDILCLEMLPGNSLMMLASIRGAARAFGKLWGVHIAMGWYGGVRLDELWLKRWKMAICICYMAGANFIYPESGHYAFTLPGAEHFAFASPEMRCVRRELRWLFRMSMIHTRPAGGPRVPMALLHGRHDGSPGLWNPYAWGQYEQGKKWEFSDEERSWELVDTFFRREDAFSRTETGKTAVNRNPPDGTFDILPAAAPEDYWKRYCAVILLGPNRMDDDLYHKLVNYVKAGGHLVISLVHFDISEQREGPFELYNDGDLRELCGFRVKGAMKADVYGVKYCRQSRFPEYDYPFRSISMDPFWIGRKIPAEITDLANDLRICASFSENYEETRDRMDRMPLLVEHTFGKGRVLTVTSFTPPGAEGIREFYASFLRVIMKGERSCDTLIASDSIRYTVFGSGDHQIFYVLNTEFDLSQSVRMKLNETLTDEITVPEADLRVVHVIGHQLLLVPELPESEFHRLKSGNWELFSPENQMLLAENAGDTETVLRINGKRVSLPAHGKVTLRISRRVPEDSKLQQFFDPDFLEEPEMGDITTDMPY